MIPPLAVTPVPRDQVEETRRVYRELCREFLAAHPEHAYRDYVASSIANEAALDRNIRAFELYAPYVGPAMKVLDWGCRHAPDSCLLRTLHPGLELHGCDFMTDDFGIFHRYARLSFQELSHDFRLPYEDRSFDAVISSGVLEHVPMEHETLREVGRVLRDDGFFFVTFLPNRFSLTENAVRWMGTLAGHNRLYDLEQSRNAFLRCGFFVERCGYHQVFPIFAKAFKNRPLLDAFANGLAPLNRTFERIPPLNRISSNLYFVLRRVHCM